MIRVVLFEDNKSFRQNLALYLASSDEIFMCASFGDAEGCVSKIQRYKHDVVLMDIQMPGISGIEALQAIKATLPDTGSKPLPPKWFFGFSTFDRTTKIGGTTLPKHLPILPRTKT
ncbi:response regulator transcription factor [Runella sp. SP2]|uniref:response regulator transcription factor n=1 Tax=Runella sp. SP2 TaxID=2268026 RepID=UPI000F08B0DC|nr:response regulator [Runella sp. SP2]AYQ34598.1 response regulator [Runella sp. SP2]